MKNIKKQIPTILYAVLLLAVAILCIYIAETTSISEFKAQTNNVYDPSSVEKTSADIPRDENENTVVIPEQTQTVEKQNEKFYADSIPRNSEKSDKYLFSQKVYGDGITELKDVFQTSVGIFVFAETDSLNGDICNKKPCVGIIKTDSYGNILKSYSLDHSYGETYITASPTVLGFVVITSSKTDNCFYVSQISYELEEAAVPYKVNAGNSAKIVNTDSSFLIFFGYDDETVIYKYDNGNFSFQSISAGEVVDVFEYETYYAVFLSNSIEHSYSFLRISKNNLTINAEVKYSGSVLLSVFPIISDGKQHYMTIEEDYGSVYSKKYFASEPDECVGMKKLGNFKLTNAYFSGTEIMLVCTGNISGTITLYPDMTTVFGKNNSEFLTSYVSDSIYKNGFLYYLAIDEQKNLALIVHKNDVYSTEYLSIKTNFAKLIINLDGSYMIFYQNGDEIMIEVI